MNGLASSSRAALDRRPRLRLVGDRCGERPEHGRDSAPQPPPPKGPEPAEAALHEDHAHVLIAGADTPGRARMLGELHNLMPSSTCFVVAEETWEVLARAAESRMVVLTDDLQDISRTSLVRLLGRRHPSLPVLAIGGRTQPSHGADAGAAGV